MRISESDSLRCGSDGKLSLSVRVRRLCLPSDETHHRDLELVRCDCRMVCWIPVDIRQHSALCMVSAAGQRGPGGEGGRKRSEV